MNLFTQELEFEKVAMTYLDADQTTWVKSIITELVTKYPPLQQYPMTVTWQRKDDKRGYAVGSLKILNGAIPVIVEDYKLYPLDVIMFGNASMPLTPQVLNEMLSNNSPFQGATNVNPKKSLELFGDSFQYSPIGNANGASQQAGSETRDAVKVASFIDNILVDEATAKDLLEKIAKADLFQHFQKNGTVAVLEKIASKGMMTADNFEKAAYFSAPIDRSYIFTDSLGNKMVKLASSEIDDVLVLPFSEVPNAKNMYAAENIEYIEKTAGLVDEIVESELVAGNYGFFEFEGVKTAEFQVLDVKFLKNEIHGEILESLNSSANLLIDEQSNYIDLDKSIEKTASNIKIDRKKEFNNGDYGVFEWNDKIVGPITISSQYTEEDLEKNASTTVNGYSSLENNRFYIKNVNFANIIPHETEKNAWYLPKDVNFIPLKKKYIDTAFMTKVANLVQMDDMLEVDVLEGWEHKTYHVSPYFDELSDNTVPAAANFSKIEKSMEKVASASVNLSHNRVIHDCEGFYKLVGDDFKKYAQLGHKTDNLTKDEALWAAIHMGANENDIDKIAKACKCEFAEIANKLKVPKSKESIKKEANEKIDEMKGETLKEARLLLKEAAVMPDMVTVDAVLSLGLMKSFNIMEYVQLIPDYERVIGELCKLLIMVRMGAKQVPEAAVKSSVEALTEVLYALKQLAMVMQNQGTKK